MNAAHVITSLRFDSISKSFPGVQALDAVSFEVPAGSVHALVGENGAGKSTLLKILSGAYQPDSGHILINQNVVEFHSPLDAINAGIAVIYQELHLVSEMSVAENVLLGHFPSKFGWLDRTQLMQRTIEQLETVGIEVDPNAKVGKLALAQRQMVEIAKALSRDANIIAFDEPTSSLSWREVERLFEIIESLKNRNKIILYVTHRMDEVFSLCDHVTVLRDGKHITTERTAAGFDSRKLVRLMVGREIEDIFGYRPRKIGDEALSVQGLVAKGLAEPATLSIKKGEIVGVFGLVGSGRTELLRAIYAATEPTHGTIAVNGNLVYIRNTSDAIRSGIALCPEDRKQEGVFPLRSVKENENISARRKRGFLIDEKWETKNAQIQVERLKVRPPSLDQPVGLLSGGNQQKVVLGRWLSENVKVLLFDEPTRGIDVGAKREIYETIYSLAESGVAILLVSSELPEVLGVCDRILVMRQGRIVADLPRCQATQESLLEIALPVAEAVA